MILFLLSLSLFAGLDSERLVAHLLNYIASDYSQSLTNPAEYQEQKDLFQAALEESKRSALLSKDPSLLASLTKLGAQIQSRAPANEVEKMANSISAQVVRLAHLSLAPKKRPSFSHGRELYQKNCVQCHGASGHGDGPSSGNLNPKPTNFFDAKLDGISPFQAFNTIKLGVPGTSMAGFELPDEDIWALSFYVVGLRHEGKPKKTAQISIEIARQRLKSAKESLEKGNLIQAEREILAGYLDGIEPIEAELKWKSDSLLKSVEAKVAELRHHLQDPQVATQNFSELDQILDQIETVLSEEESGVWNGVLAGGIVLREAFEALLILVALLGMLRGIKDARTPRLAIHTGWISALSIGVFAWFTTGWLIDISGWRREILEGVVSLLAVLLLTYVGVWLHQKAEIQKWHRYLKSKVGLALSGKNILGLWVVSFMAVFREILEVVLFLRALVLDATAGQAVWIWSGVFCSLLLAVGMAYAMLRLSQKLPIAKLFSVSSGIIIFLAVILLGKGLRAFQQVGVLPFTEIPFSFRIDMLGLYSSWETILSQIILIGIIGVLFKMSGKVSVS